MKRVMWIEYKGDELVGPARIGWAAVKDRGKRIDYRGKSFRPRRGGGFKVNYYDVNTGKEYWISGFRKDGRVFTTRMWTSTMMLGKSNWVNIRQMPEKLKIKHFRAKGECC